MSGKRSKPKAGGGAGLPSPISVGWWRIEVVADDGALRSSLDAEWQPDRSRIVVRESLRGAALLESINHELRHVEWYLAGLDEVDGAPTEEHLATVGGRLQTEIEARNPAFLAWKREVLGCR